MASPNSEGCQIMMEKELDQLKSMEACEVVKRCKAIIEGKNI